MKIIYLFCSCTLFFINVSYSAMNNFYIKANKNLIIDQTKKIIIGEGNFIFKNSTFQYFSDFIKIYYQDINQLDLEHINKIQGTGHIKFLFANKQEFLGDKYTYDLSQYVHVLQADNNSHVYYKSGSNILTANDRIEYFFNKDIIIARGKPIINGNSEYNGKYSLSSDLLAIKLINYNNSKDIDYIEASNNVIFKTKHTLITSNYAIYYKKEGQIEFKNNVKLINNSNHIKACSVIYNLISETARIIQCKKNTPIKGKLNIKNYS